MATVDGICEGDSRLGENTNPTSTNAKLILSMSEALVETVAATPVKKNGLWLVNVAVPGKGTSGTYSAEVLAESGPIAFPARTKAYFGHNLPQDRDPRDQMGTYPQGAFWNEEAGALQAYLKPYARWEPLLEEMGEDLETSMFVLNFERDDDGTVTALGPHRGNTIDAVAFGGLVGSGVKGRVIETLVESARAGYAEKPASNSLEEKEKALMDEKLDKLIALFEAFVAESKQGKAEEITAEVNAKAVESAVKEALESFDAKRVLIEQAEILPSQRDALLAAAKEGADVAPLVESAKKVYDEAKTVLAEGLESQGRDFTVTGAEDWTITGVRV